MCIKNDIQSGEISLSYFHEILFIVIQFFSQMSYNPQSWVYSEKCPDSSERKVIVFSSIGWGCMCYLNNVFDCVRIALIRLVLRCSICLNASIETRYCNFTSND